MMRSRKAESSTSASAAFGKIVDRAAVPVARAHAHDFADGERKRDVRCLREHRALQRKLARRVGGKRPALQRDRAGGGLDFAGQHAQQRRLARAVRSDDRDGLAPPKPERHAVEQRAAPRARDRRLAPITPRPTCARWRAAARGRTARRCAAVTMPIGISAGATRRARRVGDQQQERAETQRGGEQPAVVGPDHQAHQVRHHEADEADHARRPRPRRRWRAPPARCASA